MLPKTDAVVTEAIHAIAESFNAQLQELRSSQLELKTALENKLDSTLTDIHHQISQLNIANSQKSPSTIDTYKGVLSAKPTPSSFPPPSTSVFQPKTPKYFLTHFDGSNVHAWIFQAEQYFSYYSIAPDQRIPIAGFFMTGEALTWVQWMHRHSLLSDWDSFTRELEIRFGPSIFMNPQTALFKLKQTSTVANYQREFELLTNRVAGFSDEHLLNLFVSGLRQDIQREVIIQNPYSLTMALALAKLYEAKIAETRPQYRAPTTPPTPPLPSRNSQLPSTVPTSKASPLSAGRFPIRRLTATEMQARRSKGLCFNCDEQFKPGHRCKTTPFLLLQSHEESFEPVPPLNDTPMDLYPPSVELSALPLPPPPTHSPATDTSDFQVSLYALYGHSSQSCMKLQCQIRGLPFTVLIDSGSTHNLIQPKVARHLGLLIEPAPPLSVRVGNGDVLHCQGMVSALQIDLQGVNFALDLYLLDVHGAEVILGVQWKMGYYFGSSSSSGRPSHPQQLHRWAQTDAISSANWLTLQATTSEDLEQSLPLDSVPPALAALLQRFSKVFETPKGLPPKRQHDHHIHLILGSKSVNVKPYRYPHSQKKDMEILIIEMLQEGVIRPSTSPFSSPVLLVRKKDGSWRFCVDYRALNAITIRDRFPISTIDELLDKLHGASVFTKIDLRAGYHQIRIAEPDISKTAFRTSDGHFEFQVIPFDLTNAPSTFQSAMNDLFRPFLRRFVLVFFDDILVYNKSLEEHLTHLQQVLNLLLEQQFYAKLSKCSFAQSSIDYLEHIISDQGVQVDPSKIEAVMAWPQPSNVKSLRGFLGLTGYYRKFVAHYATIAAPLTDLLKSKAFHWTQSASDVFEKLKQALTSTPCLALPDFSKPFEVTTDASNVAVGAVLSQDSHPLAYFSKKLNPKLQNSSTYVREMYAITEAFKKWRQYLLGRPFIIYTDQQSLRGLMNQTIQTPEQQKWLVKLLGFQYSIQYKPGTQNKVVDALSRSFPVEANCLAISGLVFSFLDDLRQYFISDTRGKLFFQQCQDSPSEFTIVNGLIMRDGRIVIPDSHPLQQTLLHEFHSTLTGGHAGISRTLVRLSASFWWNNMRKSVKEFVSTCKVCQEVKYLTSKPQGLLEPLPIPSQAWQDIAMDFITHLPISHGKVTIWVIVDRFSKYAHFLALPAGVTAPHLAAIFAQEIVKLHGIPRSIVSDRDPLFVSKFWNELFKLQGTQLPMSSAYHPQTDGQSEVLNRCLETYLRAFVSENPKQWTRILHWAEWSYNSSFHSAACMTPFQALYGFPPPSIPSYLPGSTTVAQLDDSLIDRQQLLKQLKANLARASNRMKIQADRKRVEKQFTEGDLVLVKLQPYRQQSVVSRTSQKLSKKYFGPYKILQKIGPVAYKLELPEGSRVHPVFHVSLLRAFKGDLPATPSPLPTECVNGQPTLEPELILKSRQVKQAKKVLTQVLVKWKQLPESDSTWEWAEDISSSFPNFNLENKVVIQEGSNVMSSSSNGSSLGPRSKRVGMKPSRDHTNLQGPIPDELGQLSILEIFQLSSNNLSGIIPPSIYNLSSIYRFSVADNQLQGYLPPDIGLTLPNLEELYDNQLTGTISEVVGKLQKLGVLYLSGNRLSGLLPSSLGNLTELTRFLMDNNRFEGIIPPSLGNCQKLLVLNVSNNNLSGPIPREIMTISSLSIALSMSNNSLSGSIPAEVGKLNNLVKLDLADNRLSGEIPSSLGGCVSLHRLYLEGNAFEGTIPLALESLRGIEEIDLSRHNLSGQIPNFLSKLSFLKHLNLSHNDFEGEVSEAGIFGNASAFSVIGNNKLCGGVQNLYLPSCTRKGQGSHIGLKVVLLVTSAVIVVILLCSYASCYLLRNSRSRSGALSKQGDSRSFMDECNALRSVQHRNLLKIITACSSINHQGNDFKCLVFEYIPNGNLDQRLHPGADDQFLSINPCNDIHSLSVQPKGSIGYPEYGIGGQTSIPGDIYSYGILLLEMFTGKSPTNDMFNEDLSLHNFVEVALPQYAMDVVDLSMFSKEDNSKEEITAETLVEEFVVPVMKIGLSCSATLPAERMIMIAVVNKLNDIKDRFMKLISNSKRRIRKHY
ncbi:reverse transcriptase [Corchorus capsularis]|uniref:Reverse transcriptase n=1 Tax=Corchorus capsularis TaxID=210143 RepID=A0A1R3GC78_COCAP|nr:reverse transcriptase [Corchorus capsularis]